MAAGGGRKEWGVWCGSRCLTPLLLEEAHPNLQDKGEKRQREKRKLLLYIIISLFQVASKFRE